MNLIQFIAYLKETYPDIKHIFIRKDEMNGRFPSTVVLQGHRLVRYAKPIQLYWKSTGMHYAFPIVLDDDIELFKDDDRFVDCYDDKNLCLS